MIRLYAEYAGAPAVVRAIDELHVQGYTKLEAYSPYPVPAIETALGAPPSRLSIIVLGAGVGAAAGAYGLQWLLQARLYPLDVGGRPAHFPLAYVPITFEMGVLFAALTAVAAVFVGAQLLRLWHPSSEAEGIESSTGTRFWLEASGLDSDADVDKVTAVLRDSGSLVVRRVEELP